MFNVDKLLNKEISRREFMGLIGAGILSIVGVSALMKSLGIALEKHTSGIGANKNPDDYGQSLYGGKLNS